MMTQSLGKVTSILGFIPYCPALGLPPAFSRVHTPDMVRRNIPAPSAGRSDRLTGSDDSMCIVNLPFMSGSNDETDRVYDPAKPSSAPVSHSS